jgi:hypothetical protein
VHGSAGFAPTIRVLMAVIPENLGRNVQRAKRGSCCMCRRPGNVLLLNVSKFLNGYDEYCKTKLCKAEEGRNYVYIDL